MISSSIKRAKISVFALFFIFNSEIIFAQSENESLLMTAPVFTRDQFIFSQGRVGVGNDFISRKLEQSQALIDCAASNTITRLKRMDVDYESYYCGLLLETKILGTRVSLQSALFRTGGGIFDSAIESYHQGLRLPNGSRGRTEEDRFSATIKDGNNTTSLSRTSLSFLDPQLSISKDVYSFSSNTEGSVDFSSTIPLNESDYSLSTPELKLSLVLDSVVSAQFSYLIGVSGIYHSDTNQHGLEYDATSLGFFVTTQWRLPEYILNNSMLFTQNVVSTNNQQRFTNLYSYSWYLDVGVRIITFDKQAFEFIVRENPSPGSGTVDVSVMLRYLF